MCHVDTGSHHSVPFPLPVSGTLPSSSKKAALGILWTCPRGPRRQSKLRDHRPGLCENRAADWGPVSAQRRRVRPRGPRARALFGSQGSVPPLPVFGLRSGIQFELLVSVHVPSTGSFSASSSISFPVFELKNSQNGC